MICPDELAHEMSHSERPGWIHAREHGEVSKGRGGAGDEGAGSDFAGDGEEDHVVAGGGDFVDFVDKIS
jgi:hypothetical protein